MFSHIFERHKQRKTPYYTYMNDVRFLCIYVLCVSSEMVVCLIVYPSLADIFAEGKAYRTQ